MRPWPLLLAIALVSSGCFSWWGEAPDTEAAAVEDEPEPVDVASEPLYMGPWSPTPEDKAASPAHDERSPANATTPEDAATSEPSQSNTTTSEPAGASHDAHEAHDDAAANGTSGAAAASASDNATAQASNATSSAAADARQPQAAPKHQNESFDLSVGRAGFFAFGGGGTSDNTNCVMFRGNATSNRILGGTATLSWREDSFGAEELELVYQPDGDAVAARVRGESPLELTLTASALNQSEGRPLVFVRLAGNGGETALQQGVELDLRLVYEGPALKFRRTTCS